MSIEELKRALAPYIATHQAELAIAAQRRADFFANLCAERSEAR